MKLPNFVSRAAGRKVLTLKKNSPHIFFAGGVIGVGISTVMACRATLQLDKKLDDLRRQIDDVKENAKNLDHDYGQKEYQKDLLYVYARGSVQIGRLYAPAVAVGAISVAALTGSHIQLTRRNTALTATLAGVMKAYDDYRLRVQEVVGKEKELDIYRGVVSEEVEGEGKNKKTVKVVDPTKMSVYARFFDEFSSCWQRNNEMNRVFLLAQQNYYNHILHVRGHVFLNEVYDALGLSHTQAGSVVGWLSKGKGDGYIDFGLDNPKSYRFINGLEQSIYLDFNVDGPIYNLIEEE